MCGPNERLLNPHVRTVRRRVYLHRYVCCGQAKHHDTCWMAPVSQGAGICGRGRIWRMYIRPVSSVPLPSILCGGMPRVLRCIRRPRRQTMALTVSSAQSRGCIIPTWPMLALPKMAVRSWHPILGAGAGMPATRLHTPCWEMDDNRRGACEGGSAEEHTNFCLPRVMNAAVDQQCGHGVGHGSAHSTVTMDISDLGPASIHMYCEP